MADLGFKTLCVMKLSLCGPDKAFRFVHCVSRGLLLHPQASKICHDINKGMFVPSHHGTCLIFSVSAVEFAWTPPNKLAKGV